AVPLEIGPAAACVATLDQAALIATASCGRGSLVTLGFHPSEARDANGCAMALLRKLLIHSSHLPVAWFDLSHSVALRMDDPGAAQSVFLGNWSYRQLGAAEWARLLEVLKQRQAPLSIGYVGGWVDDGDAGRKQPGP